VLYDKKLTYLGEGKGAVKKRMPKLRLRLK
jgi:hypothetical protein